MAVELDLDRLNQYLSDKIGPCPLCGQYGTFSGMSTLMELREFNRGNLIVGGDSRIVPLAVITCSNCGNTVLINALFAKLIESNSPSKQEE